MKKPVLFFILVTISFFTGYAQTADEIIAKHIENTGGKEKLSSVTSLAMNMSITIMGVTAPSNAVLAVGKGLRNESEFNGQKIINVITDKGGWTVNPLAGIPEPQAMDEQQFLESKDQLEFAHFIDYHSKGSKLELVGREKLGDEEVYKINFINSDKLSTTCYFNTTTFYLVKAVKKMHVMGQELEIITTYSDYRKTDYGVVIAYSSTFDYGQFQIASTVKTVEFNKPVDTSIFVMKK